jgi:uncharacterized protein
MWTPVVNPFYPLSLPLVIVAAFAGRVIKSTHGADRYCALTHGGLIAIGIILLSQATAVQAPKTRPETAYCSVAHSVFACI